MHLAKRGHWPFQGCFAGSTRFLLGASVLFTSKINCARTMTTNAHSLDPTIPHDYLLPEWAKCFKNAPTNGRLHLANLPTPVFKVSSRPGLQKDSILGKLHELEISLFVKRDDMTGGVETGGNKIRKLEFLLADALADPTYKSVVTIGGEQSNHCRATAAACRMVGLEPNLILRTKKASSIHSGEQEMGTVGNVLFDRIVGSHIYLCTPGEYGRIGSDGLVKRVCKHIESSSGNGDRAYPIPVGGSNGLGTFGYINAVDEFIAQWDTTTRLDHVVFACGSGGTATGISAGFSLALGAEAPQSHAIGVCDSPDYFYQHCAKILGEMGYDGRESADVFLRQCMTVHQGKGNGYAASTPEELAFVQEFAIETGIALDPVYSGKALYHFITKVLEENSEEFRGSNVLFWHTGGALGLYDKTESLQGGIDRCSSVSRLDIYGSLENAVDISTEG